MQRFSEHRRSLLLSADKEGTVVAWDTTNGRKKYGLHMGSEVTYLAAEHTGIVPAAIAVSRQRGIDVWDARDGGQLWQSKPISGDTVAVGGPSEAKVVATRGERVQLWALGDGKHLRTMRSLLYTTEAGVTRREAAPVTDVAIGKVAGQAVIAAEYIMKRFGGDRHEWRTLRLRQAMGNFANRLWRPHMEPSEVLGGSGPIQAIRGRVFEFGTFPGLPHRESSDTKLATGNIAGKDVLAVAQSKASLRIHAANSELLTSINYGERKVGALAIGADIVFAGFSDGTIQPWTLPEGQPLEPITNHEASITALAIATF